jgi:regulatory protein
MRIVTAVEPQKFKKGVNIYLDGKFALGLDLENFVKLGLRTGEELSDKRVSEITKMADFKNISDRLVFFATLRPRSEKEITDWMIRKRVSGNLKKRLIDKMKNLELLNDEKFARWWIDQRIAFKSKSLRNLEYELKNKGISKDIIAGIMEGTDVDESRSEKKLIEKNIYKWSQLPSRIALQKKRNFLARKGFRWDIIKKAIR